MKYFVLGIVVLGAAVALSSAFRPVGPIRENDPKPLVQRGWQPMPPGTAENYARQSRPPFPPRR